MLSTTTCIPSTTSTIASGYLSRRYPVLQSEILDYPPAPPDTRRGRSPDTLLARHPPMSRSTTPCASSRRGSSRTYIRRKNNVLVFSIPARAFRTDLLRPPILMPPAAISICAPARYYIFLDLEFPHHATQITRARSFLSGCCAMMAAKYLTPLLGSHFASSGSSVHRLSRQSSRHPIRFKPASHGLHALP